jgi:hypothetical protein
MRLATLGCGLPATGLTDRLTICNQGLFFVDDRSLWRRARGPFHVHTLKGSSPPWWRCLRPSTVGPPATARAELFRSPLGFGRFCLAPSAARRGGASGRLPRGWGAPATRSTPLLARRAHPRVCFAPHRAFCASLPVCFVPPHESKTVIHWGRPFSAQVDLNASKVTRGASTHPRRPHFRRPLRARRGPNAAARAGGRARCGSADRPLGLP